MGPNEEHTKGAAHNKNPKSQELEELREKVKELENNWKRALADYKNLEKRTADEKEEFAKFATQVLISRLIFVLDSLEMLQKHINDIALGMVLKEFKQILADEGLVEIAAEGKSFDANEMEAIDQVEGEENKVIEVTQKGYKLKNKVIRPTKVKVGLGKDN